MSPVRVLVVGSSNTDFVISCPRLPRAGETVRGGKFAQFAGGKGANQAVAAARAGAKVAFVGAHGADAIGRAAKKGLRAEGVDVRYFREKREAPSGVAFIFVGQAAGENSIAVAHSANDLLSARDVRNAEREFAKADIVLAQLEVPITAVLEAGRLAKKYRKRFVLNPAPAQRIPRRLVRLVDVLTPNEREMEIIGAQLSKRACTVVVTQGSRGAVICGPRAKRISAPRVKAVDTVGAGDCFSAWLAVGLAEQLPLHDAVARAVRAAAIAVTRRGAQASMPWRREVR